MKVCEKCWINYKKKVTFKYIFIIYLLWCYSVLPHASEEIVCCCSQRGSEACSSCFYALKRWWLSRTLEKHSKKKKKKIFCAHVFRPVKCTDSLWLLVNCSLLLNNFFFFFFITHTYRHTVYLQIIYFIL